MPNDRVLSNLLSTLVSLGMLGRTSQGIYSFGTTPWPVLKRDGIGVNGDGPPDPPQTANGNDGDGRGSGDGYREILSHPLLLSRSQEEFENLLSSIGERN